MALVLVRSVANRSRAGIAVGVSVLVLIAADLFLDLPGTVDLPRDMFVVLAVMTLGLQYLAAEARWRGSKSLVVFPGAAAASEPAMARVGTVRECVRLGDTLGP